MNKNAPSTLDLCEMTQRTLGRPLGRPLGQGDRCADLRADLRADLWAVRPSHCKCLLLEMWSSQIHATFYWIAPPQLCKYVFSGNLAPDARFRSWGFAGLRKFVPRCTFKACYVKTPLPQQGRFQASSCSCSCADAYSEGMLLPL